MRRMLVWGLAAGISLLVGWSVWPRARAARRAPVTIAHDAPTPAPERRLDVDAGDPGEQVQVDRGERRVAGLAIAGRVVDFDGTGLDGVTVAARPVDAVAARWVGAESGPNGGFRIEGLQPGRHALVVRASRHARGRPPREHVLAQAGDDDVEVRLRRTAWVTIRWFDGVTNAPIETDRSVRWREGGQDRGASASGTADAALPSRAEIGHEPVLLTATADGYLPETMEIDLRDDEWSRELTFRLAPDPESLVRVELVLRDSRGDPVRDITIMRVHEDGSGTGTTYRSEDGRVVLRLPAGPNRLRFGPLIRQGHSHDRPWIVRFLELNVERAGRPTAHVVIQRGGWLRQPRWEDAPVRTARIRGTDEKFISYARDDYRACLAPGRHVVEAELSDGRELTGEVEITADRTSDVELELKRE